MKSKNVRQNDVIDLHHKPEVTILILASVASLGRSGLSSGISPRTFKVKIKIYCPGRKEIDEKNPGYQLDSQIKSISRCDLWNTPFLDVLSTTG